jgi:hypothetical protein
MQGDAGPVKHEQYTPLPSPAEAITEQSAKNMFEEGTHWEGINGGQYYQSARPVSILTLVKRDLMLFLPVCVCLGVCVMCVRFEV